MFDIAPTELLVVAVVALLVLGPERLPKALRTLGIWIGTARRSFDKIRSEIEREVGADELRREIHNNIVLEESRRLTADLQRTQAELRSAMNPASTPARNPAINGTVDATPKPPTVGEATAAGDEFLGRLPGDPPHEPVVPNPEPTAPSRPPSSP